MERFTTDGVVLKATVTGESDRIVHILTPDRGVIRAFAKGARGTKSRLHGATAQFSYGEFVFTEKNEVFHVAEAAQREAFFALRLDLKKLALAQYFCEMLLREAAHDSVPEHMRLFLNALYLLCTDKKPLFAVKSVFELRLACISGYAPALIACDTCGAYETPRMYFDTQTGLLYCETCGQRTAAAQVPASVVAAMRHIVFSQPERLFSFELGKEALKLLSDVTEKYVQSSFQYRFRLLEFFYASL